MGEMKLNDRIGQDLSCGGASKEPKRGLEMSARHKEKTPTAIKVIAVIFIIVYWWTIIGIIAGIFLWMGKNWARIIAVIMCGLSSVLGFLLVAGLGVSNISGIINVTMNLAIIYYLLFNSKVDRYFGRM